MHIDSIHRTIKNKKNTNLHIIHRDTSLSKLTSTQTLRETKDAQIRHGTSIKNIGHDLISKDAHCLDHQQCAQEANTCPTKLLRRNLQWKRIGVIELKSSADKHCLWMFKVQTPGLSAVAVDAFRCGINGKFLIDVEWCWCSLLVWWCLHTQITLDLVKQILNHLNSVSRVQPCGFSNGFGVSRIWSLEVAYIVDLQSLLAGESQLCQDARNLKACYEVVSTKIQNYFMPIGSNRFHNG